MDVLKLVVNFRTLVVVIVSTDLILPISSLQQATHARQEPLSPELFVMIAMGVVMELSKRNGTFVQYKLLERDRNSGLALF